MSYIKPKTWQDQQAEYTKTKEVLNMNNKIYVYAFIGKIVLNIVCYSALVLLVLCAAEYCLSDNTSYSSYITENIENELYNACGLDPYCRDVFVEC